MTKESLEQMKVKELASICKSKGIQCYRGKNLIHKGDEMIALILESVSNEDAATKAECQEDTTKPKIDMERKMRYIERAEIGMLVAFRLANGKVKSAKIIKRSTKNKRFMLETEYGARYIVNYGDILWVRTTKRWPLGVYKLLKGLSDNEHTENGRK